MILKVFAVRDAAADVFGKPYFVPSNGVAIRGFTDEVNRKAEDNTLNKHAKDFSLYELGEYDDSFGGFNLHEQPKLLINADSCLVE